MNELERNLAREFLDDSELDGYHIVIIDEHDPYRDDECGSLDDDLRDMVDSGWEFWK